MAISNLFLSSHDPFWASEGGGGEGKGRKGEGKKREGKGRKGKEREGEGRLVFHFSMIDERDI